MKKCSSCSEEISAARLKAKPNADMCIVCQSNSETTERRPEVQRGYYTLEQVSGNHTLLSKAMEIMEKGSDVG